MELDSVLLKLKSSDFLKRSGRVLKVGYGFVEASGPFCTLGDICEIETPSSEHRNAKDSNLAEVVNIDDDQITLIPFDTTIPIYPDAEVYLRSVKSSAPVGNNFGGTIVDALGDSMELETKITPNEYMPLEGVILSPLQREVSNKIVVTGVKAIDGLLPLARGQRTGIFAASGVGKTSLVKQIISNVDADRSILCLLGERGREVEGLWRDIANRSDRDRFSFVAATSDKSAILRARALYQSLSMAEYWRDKGEHVLLVVDSITRFAMALRDIGLASGAPPTLRAYTPNVFSALPRVVERCGAQKGKGAITSIFTVLSETDDVDDPIVEVMKSLLDGHIVLSRELAEKGQFPAIDIAKSVSRESYRVMSKEHQKLAQKAVSGGSVYEENRIMVESGIYKNGTNSNLDFAISIRENLVEFLKQDGSPFGLNETISLLQNTLNEGSQNAQ